MLALQRLELLLKTTRIGVLLGTGAQVSNGLKYYCEIINYSNLELEAWDSWQNIHNPGGWWGGGWL